MDARSIYTVEEYSKYSQALMMAASNVEETKNQGEKMLNSLCKCQKHYICPVCSLRTARKILEETGKVILL